MNWMADGLVVGCIPWTGKRKHLLKILEIVALSFICDLGTKPLGSWRPHAHVRGFIL